MSASDLPELIACESRLVHVELDDRARLGQTVFGDGATACRLVTTVDRETLFARIARAMQVYGP